MNHLTIEAGSNVPERFTEILDQNFDPKQQNAVCNGNNYHTLPGILMHTYIV